MKRVNEYDNRVFVINKAAGPTSFDVVAALRRAARLRKVGHTGTLDPLARGVLILCTGVATRAVEQFMNLEKEYAFTARLGVETDTLDAEGEVVRETPCHDLSESDVRAAAQTFVGEYSLVPPRYSALKRGGRRMYDRARSGEDETPEPRLVRIYSFEVTGIDGPDVHCVVRCSRGTYVRSIARDLGAKLGLPAHVAALARTRVGPFRAEDGFPSQRLERGDLEGLEGLDPCAALSFLPGVVLSARARRELAYGGLPGAQDVVRTVGELSAGAVRLMDEDERLLAVGTRRDDAGRDRLHVVDSFRLLMDPSDVAGFGRSA